jgi:hypothetical protein
MVFLRNNNNHKPMSSLENCLGEPVQRFTQAVSQLLTLFERHEAAKHGFSFHGFL